ncbi:phosphatidylserine decarboxylase-domain-containing protein [Cantharellus anzutake]|uniref:phosphatidylserine decarboxylase-domain-containing protein n=1 Tax=Cantharellus anzutake TaxID=1750568 RepID=UPI001904F9AC|nr:phosphatidylserine decarboxylase-domain-containing protein [Cantharellus anzutake]KAF8311921.1 phosphatidylserine decarboxylase-domain-containing protein [Cantharellus anzutake]
MVDVVTELRQYLFANPDVYRAFALAVRIVLRMNIPQLEQLGIRSLNDYLDFYETLLNWVPTETSDGRNIYYHLCIFYFILDQLPLRLLQTPILPTSTPPYTWLSDWVISFAKAMGANMDKPESLTPESLQTFYDAPSYRMEDYIVPEGGWQNFNEFFARELKPGLRPIDAPDDSRVIVGSADSVFDGFWLIEDEGVVYLKYIPWPVKLLLADSAYGDQFDGGAFTHSFLAPNDYHRQHAPVSGTVLEAKVIPGLCYLEVEATTGTDGKISFGMRRGLPEAEIGRGARKWRRRRGEVPPNDDINAPNSPGYQFLQARGLIVIDNPVLGLVAVLPVGMAQISSVVLSVQPGQQVEKGDEISYFQCGGSDCVIVFQKGANVQFTATIGEHYNYGEKIAESVPDD